MGNISIPLPAAKRTDVLHEAAKRLTAHIGELVKVYPYRHRDGSLAFSNLRIEQSDGKKTFRMMAEIDGEWKLKRPEKPAEGWPLYWLPAAGASPNEPVFVVEGEKDVDSLISLGLVAFTSGGANTVDDADWTPLRGRRVILWPDNDAAGCKYMDRVQAKLSRLGCRIELIDVAALGLAEKGDCSDWLAMNTEVSAGYVLTLPRAAVSVDAVAIDADASPCAILACGSDVVPESVDWLWKGWLAAGKLHIIAGAPGTGKTTLAASLAATVTRGGSWPDGTVAGQGRVVFWSGEDDNADTLNPRFRAAGADMDKVFVVDGVSDARGRQPFDPARNMDALRRAILNIPDLRLLVLDPIVSAITGDSHKNAEVRAGLQPLADLARECRCAVLGVTHFTKGTAGREPSERVTGSLAFVAAPRVVMVTAKQQATNETSERRLLVRAKSNIGPDGDGFSYDLRQEELAGFLGVLASSVVWGEPVEGSAQEILAEAEQRVDEHSGDAKSFLRDLLARGPMLAADVFRDAESAGYSRDAVKRAKRHVGVKIAKRGMQGGWEWRLPDTNWHERSTEEAEGSEECGQENVLPSLPSREAARPLDGFEMSFDEAEATATPRGYTI